MFSSLFHPNSSDLPIRVVSAEDLSATEDLAYPTQFAEMLATSERAREQARATLNDSEEQKS